GPGDLAGGRDDVGGRALPGHGCAVVAGRGQVEVAADVLDVVDDERVGGELGALGVVELRQYTDREALLGGEAALAQRRGERGRRGLRAGCRAGDDALRGDDVRVGGLPRECRATGRRGGQHDVRGEPLEAVEHEGLDVRLEGDLGVERDDVGDLLAGQGAVVDAEVLDRTVHAPVGVVGRASDVVGRGAAVPDVGGGQGDVRVLSDELSVDVEPGGAVLEGVGDVLPHAALELLRPG